MSSCIDITAIELVKNEDLNLPGYLTWLKVFSEVIIFIP